MSDATFGKYRLIAELGHGGMADVFLAVVAGPVGSGFSKLTVVKRLRQNLAEEPEFVEMLVDEARISARLNHPNVIQTNEVGSVGNQYFLAMEYLDGQPLHRIQHRAQQVVAKSPPNEPVPEPFPRECQYLVIADTLAGLHYAHDLADYDGSPLGIVHRDVTPHNVFVTYEGQVKVVDFGIAKAAGRSSETRQGVVKGKVRYMAPEQALGQVIDRRADVFAVGIMLWEAATGKRLWQGVDEMEIVQKLISGTVNSSPRAVRPDVPEEIDRICRKALSRKLEDRYQSADDLRVDLEQFLAEQGSLVSARRKLGPAIAELFKDKRSEIRAIIDTQLAAVKQDDLRSSMSLIVSQPTDSAASMPNASTSSATIARVTLGATATPATDGRADPPMALDRRLAVGLAAVATFMLVGIGVAAVGRSSERAAEAKGPTTPSASVAPVTRKIHVVLSAKPAGARILIDGAEVSAPYDAQVVADGSVHTVRIEAKGYEPRVEVIRFDSDVSFSFALPRARENGDGPAHAATVAAPVAVSPNAAATTPPSTASAGAVPVEPTAHATTGTASASTTPPGAPTLTTTKKGGRPTIDTTEDPWASKR